jgi:hypothetical protein
MCHYYETLKPNLSGLSVVVFTCMLTLRCSETSEVNFGGLNVDFFMMITCQCIETLVSSFFYVNNLSLKSHVITLIDEMDFIYMFLAKV